MFERFTDRARQVVVRSHEAALGLTHNYIGTEHLLLGLVREEDGLAQLMLGRFGLTAEAAHAEVVRIVGRGSGESAHSRLPFTPRAAEVLSRATRVTRDSVDTEHLLLALALEEQGVAARILLAFGVSAEAIQTAAGPMLGDPNAIQTAAGPTLGDPRAIADVDVELGSRARPIALAALGAALLTRSAFDADRIGGLAPLEMQLLAHLALGAGRKAAQESGEEFESLSGALACERDEVGETVRSLVGRRLVVHSVGSDADRVAITQEGMAAVEDWLQRIASLFGGWPATTQAVDDTTG